MRQVRQGTRWSQGLLAEKTGVTRQTINSIENGRSEPSLELALRLAKAFGLKVEELFMLDPEPEADTQGKEGNFMTGEAAG